MTQGFRSLVIAMVLAGLILFGLINFAIDTAEDNNANQTILENRQINQSYAGLKEDLEKLESQAQEQRKNFEEDTVSTGLGFFILTTIIGGGRVFTGLTIGIFNTITEPLSSVLGIPVAVLGVFSFILLITLMLLAWRLYKQGE